MKKIGLPIALLLQAMILVDELLLHNYWQAGVVAAVLCWLLWLRFVKEDVNAGRNDKKMIVSEAKPIEPTNLSGETASVDVNTQSEASSAHPKKEPDESHADEIPTESSDSDAVQKESSSAQPLQVAENLDDDFCKALGVLKAHILEGNYIAAKKVKRMINGRQWSDILSNNADALRNNGFGFWKEDSEELKREELREGGGSAFFKLRWAGDAKEFCGKITKLATDDISNYLLKPENMPKLFGGQKLWQAATNRKYEGILDPAGKHIIPLRTETNADTSSLDRTLIENLERLGIGCGKGRKIYLLLKKEEACRYLQEDFGKDLKTWFAMSQNEELGCDVVRSVYNHNRPQNNLIDNERRTAIFAAAFCAMLEKTLGIVNDKGEKEAAAYCKQHSWPLCNVRQYDGTLLSAKQIAEKAGLDPDAKLFPIETYKSFYYNAVPLFKDLMSGSETV